MDELIIRISKDSIGENVSLNNMSLDLVNTLKDILTSFSNFANITESQSDVRISLFEGSVGFALRDIPNETSDTIIGIFDGTEKDTAKIRYLKEVQEALSKYNSQQFSFILNRQGKNIDYTNEIKAKVVSFKRVQKTTRYSISFIEGILYDCGGKNPNIHINHNNVLEYTIGCTEAQAKAIVNKLYGKVFLSVLKVSKAGVDKPTYQLLETYLSKDTMDVYKTLHQSFESKTGIDKYGYLFDSIQEIILNPNKPNTEINKVIRLFNNINSDKGTLNTILIAAKPVSKEIETEYNNLLKEFQKR